MGIQSQRSKRILPVLILTFICACQFSEPDHFAVEFRVMDDAQEPVREVFVSVFRMVGSLDKKLPLKNTSEQISVRSPSAQVKYRIVKRSDSALWRSCLEMESEYETSKLQKCYDSHFQESPHFGLYFDWTDEICMEGHEDYAAVCLKSDKLEVNVPYSINMEFLEFDGEHDLFQVIPYVVPIKYFAVFRKIGYEPKSIVIDPGMAGQTIEVQLRRVSANPHLDDIHRTVRQLMREDWNTSSRSQKKMNKLMDKLAAESVYARDSGLYQDRVALKEILLSGAYTVRVIRNRQDAIDAIIADDEQMLHWIVMAELELELEEPDIAFMNELFWKMGRDVSRLVRGRLFALKNSDFPLGEFETNLLDKAVFVYGKYLSHLNNIEYVFPTFPRRNELASLYVYIRQLPAEETDLDSIRENLNILALRSLKVNPFQSEAWRAFDLTYEESQHTNTADEE